MNVRAWAVIGGPEASAPLPPDREIFQGRGGDLPPAAGYQPGSWLVWGAGTGPSLTYVCVDTPIQP